MRPKLAKLLDNRLTWAKTENKKDGVQKSNANSVNEILLIKRDHDQLLKVLAFQF